MSNLLTPTQFKVFFYVERKEVQVARFRLTDASLGLFKEAIQPHLSSLATTTTRAPPSSYKVSFLYKDDEGDDIQITSDLEWAEMMSLNEKKGATASSVGTMSGLGSVGGLPPIPPVKIFVHLEPHTQASVSVSVSQQFPLAHSNQQQSPSPQQGTQQLPQVPQSPLPPQQDTQQLPVPQQDTQQLRLPQEDTKQPLPQQDTPQVPQQHRPLNPQHEETPQEDTPNIPPSKQPCPTAAHPSLKSLSRDLVKGLFSLFDPNELRKTRNHIYNLLHAAPEEEPIAWYRAACQEALLGNIDEALDYLDRAVDLGFTDLGQLLDNVDFEIFRSDDRFNDILNKLTTPTPADGRKDDGVACSGIPVQEVKKAGKWDEQLRQLHEMGYTDDDTLIKLLDTYKGSLDKTVVALIDQ